MEGPEKNDRSKSGWEDLFFKAFHRISENTNQVGSAVSWVKTAAEDLQDRLKEEVAARLSKLDWDHLAIKAADHLAEKYKMKITIEWEPKTKAEPHDSLEKKSPYEEC